MTTEEEDFYRSARFWGRRLAQRLGLSHSDVEECEQAFVVQWLLKPVDPPRWTWPQARREAFLRRAARNHAINYLHSLHAAAAPLAWSVLETQEARSATTWIVEEAPEANLLRELFWEKIECGMCSLSPEQYLLLVRSHVEEEGLSDLAVAASLSLLDEVGRLQGLVPDSQVSAWRQQLNTPHLKPEAAAKLRLQIGEVELAKYEQPERAIAQFEQVKEQTRRKSALHGLAAYDAAVALFHEGAYRKSEQAFRALLKDRHPSPGLNRRQAARWLDHARACAGYHALRERAGIREPSRLDPLCGAEALAVALRALHRPFDRKSVLQKVRVTGEGSNMQDLVEAGKKLGLAPHVVTAAGPEGLKLLPMPLVAAVEHDHFVAIYRTDPQGVTYLCSDCGSWPGGQRTVSWKQWKLMEGGPYLTLSLPGSVEDQALSRLESAGAGKKSQALSTSTAFSSTSTPHHLQLAGYGGQGDMARVAQMATLLKANAVLQYPAPPTQVTCGSKLGAQACTSTICCPKNEGGNQGGGGGGGGGPVRALAAPSGGDPVNLATGEEEYRPVSNLTVYNPIGPSVTLTRLYNSLRPADPTYESDDFGVGWSHNYNVSMYDPTVSVNARILQGHSANCVVSGSDSPNSGSSWDIVLNGTSIASSSSSNGWSVTLQNGPPAALAVTAPSTATIATNYEVRYHNGPPGFGASKSSGFDILSSSSIGQVPQGSTGQYSNTGTDAPGTGLTWDIVQGSTVVATSTTPNGWSVSTILIAGCPPEAAPGVYEARTHFAGQTVHSGSFQVYVVDYRPKAGTRYLIEANGARVPITAGSVPSSTNTTVVCSVPAGYPLYVEWKYLSGYTSGYYVITSADRSKMVTTTAAKALGVTAQYGPNSYNAGAIMLLLSQMLDNNGNAINFSYSGVGPSGFPLLASISDSNSVALVTFTHDSTSGGITAMNDRYSRSIVYNIGAYATVNVPAGWPQFFYEVDHVSQVVATGTASPPDRYAYGYQAINNGEGVEQVPFLHTLTVPSPTGTGNATATINYATDGTCVVTSTVDANGNKALYTPVASVSSTQVTLQNSSSVTAYQYTADFDANMSETGRTNGAGVYQDRKTFGDANDPFRPSQVTNALSQSTSYTWDSFGNCKTTTSPRNTVTTYTYSYTNFPLGELTQVQEGTKTATSLTYYEPSGLIHTITSPKPGTAGSSQTVTSTWTYDALGNVLTEVGPGNNAVASITTTFNYTTDGTYSQSAAIRQPLTRTDNLGHVTHMRYDSRANMTAVIDALVNETDLTYNLANQNVSISFPATGSSGTGRSSFTNTYLYVGGPKTAESQNNESNTQVFQIAYSLGGEAEELSRTGSTQPYTAVYDAFYRPVSISDGNSHATQLFYNAAGYAYKTVYPNGDTIQYTSFDNLGNPTQRQDGRGVITNYLYTDAESKLTDVQYPASTGINVHLHYDLYGRLDSVTDGSGSHAYSFDDRDERLTDTTTYTGLAAMTLTSTFNPDGSRASLILPDSTSFSYSYDGAARAVGLTNPSGQTWSWSYLDNNWMSQQTANGQIFTTPPGTPEALSPTSPTPAPTSGTRSSPNIR